METENALPIADTWLPLGRRATPNKAAPALSETAREIAARFDYTAEHAEFFPWLPPDLPDDWGVGVIVGGSGSGKSTLLREVAAVALPEWDDSKAIVDHLGPGADERFYAVGLSSVPTWMKPYGVLSNGERFRADLARQLTNGAGVDEFTSVVDRNVAKATCRSLRKYVNAGHVSRLSLATVHRDILPWLEPDWVIDTDAGMWAIRPRECLHRRPMVADVYEVDRSMWDHFMGHHYLTNDLHPFARCYLAIVSGTPVAFAAAIPFPHGHIANGWRGTRLVTFPDFQGLGVGPRLADWVAEAHVRAGYSYYVKTTHPRLGEYRDAHPNWRSTGARHKRQATAAPRSFTARRGKVWVGSSRVSYSHKYELASA